ncbi:tetratricopeptide repeat protein [Pelagibacterium xiamenense]|uniref:tetratricopeptide repeat protein n=1 Tax=Pelagibacterium xiamenense TaxID=2901140 RepID=UPI001E562DD8|nr:tetratricopeptide repeat protein [Pelagibacterium xiamenense]MCD7060340.1 tetratricopeptide repeat protein [Pelagibacterium xiamenense]
MRDLLAWDVLRRSPQLGAFLTYVVEARLRGDETSIKAYSIAVDVLGREEDFDPQSDPIVRVQARRLRSLLAEYYAVTGTPRAVRITLPRGRYVPEFIFQTAPPPETAPPKEIQSAPTPLDSGDAPPPRKHRPLFETVLLVGGLAVVFIILSLVLWPNISRRDVVVPSEGQPLAPLVIVQEFENLANDAIGEPLAAGLAVELVTDFGLFPYVEARYGGTQAAATSGELASGRPVFVLSGVVRRAGGGVQYGALLSRVDANMQPVSFDVNAPVAAGRVTLSIDDVSRYFAMRLASPRGVLHAPARRWIEVARDTEIVLAPYPCMVAFRWYEEAFDPVLAARVNACAGAHLSSESRGGEAGAMLASIQADEAVEIGVDLPEAQDLLVQAETQGAQAADHMPTSAFVWAQYAHVASVTGDHLAARDRYNTALQLNPADVNVLAHFAIVLAQMNNWAPALEHANAALAAEDDPPPRFHFVPALWALRNGEYDTALSHAREMVRAYPSFGAAVMVAIGGQTRDSAIIDTYLSRLLALESYRRLGILPALRQMTGDPAVLLELSNGISQAGVPLDRLVNPF